MPSSAAMRIILASKNPHSRSQKMPAQYDRRTFMTYFASIGLGSTLLPGILWAKTADGMEITAATIAAAEEMAGLKFDDAERTMMLDGLKQQEQRIEALHKIPLANSISPALVFNPVPMGKKIPNDALLLLLQPIKHHR